MFVLVVDISAISLFLSSIYLGTHLYDLMVTGHWSVHEEE